MPTTSLQNTSRIRFSSDIGGTFTDIVLETPDGLISTKVPTNVSQPELGVLEGVDYLLEKADIKESEVQVFIHGTTLATNALIERKGAKTALITNDGFRDSVEIAYESRYNQYDLQIDKPEQLVSRDLRFTVAGRMGVSGNELIPLDTNRVKSLSSVFEQLGIEAVAIGFLHSYANSEHEQKAREALLEAGCSAQISLSCEVCPEIREYERILTTICNAYVQPIMGKYLKSLHKALKKRGFSCPFLLMTSGGGITNLDTAIRFPIRLVESGPSGGAVLASRIAFDLQHSRILSFDMGGTTAKLCLLEDYQPKTARNFEIARSARFQKGSGMPVLIPVIEMIEIGAGGGSIAQVDAMGRLNIGPESAGSTPGAACYAKGGVHATVTDANLSIGKIDPDTFAEGKMQLDAKAAETAISKDVAVPLTIDPSKAAIGITEMVEENMANAARIHAVEHGADLSKFSMIAFGGGGPLHAASLAKKLGIGRVIIPFNPSVGSAIGFLDAPISYELVQSCYMKLYDFDFQRANKIIEDMVSRVRSIVCDNDLDMEVVEHRSAYMRYLGQGHQIRVETPVRSMDENDAWVIKAAYEREYQRLYGRTIPERDIEIISWSIVISEKTQNTPYISPELVLSKAKPKALRSVFLAETDSYQDIPVYARNDLAVGNCFKGPALITEAQTTVYVTSGFDGKVDEHRNLILDKTHE